MVEQAIEWLDPQSDERVLDLFCGLGNFSLPIAKRAKHVVGVEGVAEMVEKASNNAVLGAKRVVYVSCNPATLARDSQSLLEQGYQLTKLGMLDMFPHTSHLESMALFEKS